MSDLVKPAVFFGEEKIRERILDIGRRITADYDGSDVALVGILKGTIVFMADLIRAIDRPLTCDFLNVELAKDQRIDIAFSPETNFRARDVLLLQDVIEYRRHDEFHLGTHPRRLATAFAESRRNHR